MIEVCSIAKTTIQLVINNAMETTQFAIFEVLQVSPHLPFANMKSIIGNAAFVSQNSES